MLPFTAPDEPLYLIYAINRVVQLRAGPLEANFKAWSSSLLQREGDGTPHGNGMYQRVPHEPILTTQVQSMDLNGTFQQNLDVQPYLVDMTSVDLNGTNHQLPDYPLSHNGGSKVKPHTAGFADSLTFSEDDTEKFQVLWSSLLLFLSILLTICAN